MRRSSAYQPPFAVLFAGSRPRATLVRLKSVECDFRRIDERLASLIVLASRLDAPMGVAFTRSPPACPTKRSTRPDPRRSRGGVGCRHAASGRPVIRPGFTEKSLTEIRSELADPLSRPAKPEPT